VPLTAKNVKEMKESTQTNVHAHLQNMIMDSVMLNVMIAIKNVKHAPKLLEIVIPAHLTE